jgi:hypothetical protein
VGAKADILCLLLGSDAPWITVRDIARASSYTPDAVRKATEEMAASQFIQKGPGSPASYNARPSRWSGLLAFDAVDAPHWLNWQDRFAFVAAFLEWAGKAQRMPLSDYALQAHGRELLEKHWAAFAPEIAPPWNDDSRAPEKESFVDDSVRALARWMRKNV